jgi:hypothetical protein
LFNIWKAMIQRCENQNHDAYHLYGGRGISICTRWRQDFEAFAADVGERPSLGHTLDRIDGNGNYEPGNTRWATHTVQQNNRSDTLEIEWEGQILSGTQAAALAGLELQTFYYRIKAGWTIDRIMTTPVSSNGRKGEPKPKRSAA